MSVVSYAEAQFAQNDFDRAYCVFDRDEHQNYAQAVQRISQLENFYAITSCPCFEIWILLHFLYSSAPRARDAALAEVIQYYPTYQKGSRTVFDDISPRLPDAMRHAKRLLTENQRNGSINPATKMHELVEYLVGLNR